MKKSQLRNIIRESIKQLMTEQTNPDARRIYGCDCSVAPGRVYTQAEVIAYNASNPNSIFDDLGGGGYLPVGQNGELYLICEDNNYWNIPNAIVDCSTPQDGQIIYQTGGATNTIRIADNGVMSEWDNGPIKSHQTSTCGGSGVYPHDCSDPDVDGCIDNLAINYDPNATIDNGTCEYDFSDPNIKQGVRLCTCEDAPLDETGQPNSSYACNGGSPIGTSLRFSSTPAPALNLINYQAQVDDVINGAEYEDFPINTMWKIVDLLGVGTGGGVAVQLINQGGCVTSNYSGNVPGVGYVGTKPRPTRDPQIDRMQKIANITKKK